MPSASITAIALLLFVVVLAAVTAGVLLALRAQERRRAARGASGAALPLPLPFPHARADSSRAESHGPEGAGALAAPATEEGASPNVAQNATHELEEDATPVEGEPGQSAILARAERAEQVRNVLLSKMNHDIRTPLNAIITLSGLLVEGNAGPLSVEQVRYLEVIQRSGESLLSLVSAILDLSALEAGRIETDERPVDLTRLLADLEEECRRRAKSKGLAFHLSLPREPVTVHGDQDRLRQVVVGLVESAVATTSHGYVEASLIAKDAEARIQITDTGAGPAMVARGQSLDDYLAQLDPLAQRPGEGAPALSVLLASRLIPLMGGALRVDGTPGEGTTYSLVFPAQLAEKSVAPTRVLEEARSPLPPARDLSDRDRDRDRWHDEPLAGHVLIIEDDELERQRLHEVTQALGCEVTTARSGKEGLGLLAEGGFDAVILDLVMPGMTGLDVLRAARADERMADVPFIVVSALFMTRSEREVLGPGVVAVVRKGDSATDELRVGLRSALERRRSAPAARTDVRRAATSGTPAAPAGPHGVRQQAPRPQAHVLVVDDNADNLFAIRQVLAALPVSIETAASGPEAIAACRRRRPDLVVMDVELPGQSGLQTTRAIHALPDCQHIPVIAITADAMRGDRERALAAECSDYLAKPIQPKQVVSAVTRALHIQVH